MGEGSVTGGWVVKRAVCAHQLPLGQVEIEYAIGGWYPTEAEATQEAQRRGQGWVVAQVVEKQPDPQPKLKRLTNRELLNGFSGAAWEVKEWPGDKRRFHRYLAYKLEILARMEASNGATNTEL